MAHRPSPTPSSPPVVGRRPLVVGRRPPDGTGQVELTGARATARAGAPVLVVPAPSGQLSRNRDRARRHAVALAP